MAANAMRMPEAPYSHEAEQAVIGALLISGDTAHEVFGALRADDFYILRHQYIYEAMQRLHDEHQPLDFISVQAGLEARKRLQDIGGPGYLLLCANNCPTSVHATVYASLVRRASMRRRLLVASDRMRTLALDEEMPLESVLAEMDKAISTARGELHDRTERTTADVLQTVADSIETRMTSATLPGIPTGFRMLDQVLSGFRAEQSICLAGRPGMGKTALMLSALLQQAKLGVRVGIFTMEMSAEELVYRLVAMDTGINLQKVMTGQLDTGEWSRFLAALPRIAGLPIYIDDGPAQSPATLKTKILRWRHQHGLDVVYIDYLGLMRSGLPKLDGGDDRVGQISYITRELKVLAKELKLPVAYACQLNRELEKRKDKRPQLSDLRDSGTIEQDADVVIFLYRDGYYNKASEFPNRTDVIIAKQRNGPTDTLYLHFEESMTRFTDARLEHIDLTSLSVLRQEEDRDE